MKSHVAVVGIAHLEPETSHVQIVLVYSQEHNDKVPMLKFPGGRRRNGETSLQTAIREVKEETGLILQSTRMYHAGEREMGPREERYDYHVYLTSVDSFDGIKNEYVDPDASIEGKTNRKLVITPIYIDEIDSDMTVPILGGMEILSLHAQFIAELEKRTRSMQ